MNFSAKQYNQPPTSMNSPPLINQYIEQLDAKEYKAFLIAKTHLGCLLHIPQTNGFLQWVASQQSLLSTNDAISKTKTKSNDR